MSAGVTGPGGSGPAVGAVYLLTETDYRFGLGDLLARVTRVIAPVEFGQGGRVELWWQVEAVCAVPHPAGPGQHRSLYIRADCLARTRQPIRPYPPGTRSGAARCRAGPALDTLAADTGSRSPTMSYVCANVVA